MFISIKSFSNGRTLYVDNFIDILGSPSKENKLLLFAKKNNFKILILYQLNKVDKKWPLSDPRKNNVLADFILKAKTKYSIQNIGASGEAAVFFTNIIDVYNNSRSKLEEKIDIYNLEFEYWSKKASGEDGYYCENYLRDNSLPCNREGSFSYFIDNLKALKILSKNSTHKIQVEAYVGYYSEKEIRVINKHCDRILIHAFGKNPKSSFNSANINLANLLKINSDIKTSILLSTRMNHMGYWLKFNSLKSSEKIIFDKINIKTKNVGKNLNFDGFSYQTYSYLEKSINFFSYRQN